MLWFGDRSSWNPPCSLNLTSEDQKWWFDGQLSPSCCVLLGWIDPSAHWNHVCQKSRCRQLDQKNHGFQYEWNHDRSCHGSR